MAQGFNWSEYKPSKTLWFWSCAGCVVATMVIGFTWGGWVTGGTAKEMAAEARENGRATLAAHICVERFLDAPQASVQLAELKGQSTWQRDKFLEEAGWVTPIGFDEPIDGAADICADQLAEMELPAAEDSATAASGETSVN